MSLKWTHFERFERLELDLTVTAVAVAQLLIDLVIVLVRLVRHSARGCGWQGCAARVLLMDTGFLFLPASQ
jgi:hypothetical protein